MNNMEELPQNDILNNMNYSMFDQITHPGMGFDLGSANINQNINYKQNIEK